MLFCAKRPSLFFKNPVALKPVSYNSTVKIREKFDVDNIRHSIPPPRYKKSRWAFPNPCTGRKSTPPSPPPTSTCPLNNQPAQSGRHYMLLTGKFFQPDS
jgi:hypothetical protein